MRLRVGVCCCCSDIELRLLLLAEINKKRRKRLTKERGVKSKKEAVQITINLSQIIQIIQITLASERGGLSNPFPGSISAPFYVISYLHV